MPSHPTTVRKPAEQDINGVYPIDRLHELADAGLIGGVTSAHISYLGTIKKLTDLVANLAPDMVRAAKEARSPAASRIPQPPARQPGRCAR